MRYLGHLGAATGPAIPLPAFPSGGPLDPAAKAAFLAMAPNVPDDQAQDLLDFVDATDLGKKQKLMRIGMGAAGGLLVGAVLAMVLKKK
jgi:hypothetical protein